MFYCDSWLDYFRNIFLTTQTLIIRYTSFAILAMFLNLMVQRLILWFGDSNGTFICALVSGTVIGLVVKYILDKRWIFERFDYGIKVHAKLLPMYILMGIFTTVIFWCTEIAFWFIWGTDAMREIGAIIGLCIGYIVKYFLDKRFVFKGSKRTWAL